MSKVGVSLHVVHDCHCGEWVAAPFRGANVYAERTAVRPPHTRTMRTSLARLKTTCSRDVEVDQQRVTNFMLECLVTEAWPDNCVV